MIKNLKIKDKLLPFLLISTFVLSATGCSSKKSSEETVPYDYEIQLIDYNGSTRKNFII